MPNDAPMIWAELMDGGGTPRELWARVRRLAPAAIIRVIPVAFDHGRDMLGDPSSPLIERRRALLLVTMLSHRVVFDMMGLERDADADLHAPVPWRFFPQRNRGR